MKKSQIRKASFAEPVKKYTEKQFRDKFPHLTEEEKVFYLLELGITSAKQVPAESKEKEKVTAKGDN